MYLPAHFEETRAELLHALMRAHPFATLVTLADGALYADHLPFEFDPALAPFGTLRCHVARSNPVWRSLEQGVQPLVVFQGEHAYITPSWYPSKADTHKVVPTYNYMVVHAQGDARVVEDADWLRDLVTRLTQRFEAPREQPWAVADAPSDYIDTMLKAIVGIEIPLTRLSGKWKNSQNRSAADQAGVLRGLQAGGAQALAEALAQRLAGDSS
jgi:transcriptional regulator